jgi:hypothetical protein
MDFVSTFELLLKPQLPKTSALSVPSDKAELGEIAYTLPLANGQSLFDLGKDS